MEPFVIGAAAVLSVAVSGDGAFLAAGCLDKRVRIWPSLRGAAPPHEWVGFEGGVTTVEWSPPSTATGTGTATGAGGCWLAAIGGRTLLVVGPDRKGSTPILLCAVDGDAASQPLIAAICWTTTTTAAATGTATRLLLAAIESTSCRTHLFDPNQSSDTIPKRAHPLITIDSPSGSSGSSIGRSIAPPCLAFLETTNTLLISDGRIVGAKAMVKADELPPPQVEEEVVELEEGSTTTPLSPDIPILALVQCVLNGGSSEAAVLTALTYEGDQHISLRYLTRQAWACVDLSLLPRPIRFFEHGGTVSLRERFKVTTTLIIQFCNDLLDEHLSYLPPSLTSLTLDACHNITDQGIKTAAKHCGKRLELLSIYWNTHIGDPSCLALSIRCPSLTSISFSGCKQVGASGILAISSRCKKLQHLNLTRCRGEDDIALSAVHRQHEPKGCGYMPVHSIRTRLSLLQQAIARIYTLDCTGLAG